MVCLLIHLGLLLWWEFTATKARSLASDRAVGRTPRVVAEIFRHSAGICFVVMVALAFAGYVCNSSGAVEKAQFPVLLTSIVLGKALATMARSGPSLPCVAVDRATFPLLAMLSIIVGALFIAVVFGPISQATFAYHNIRRWCGLWDNPNQFGLLAGTGLVLASGSALSMLHLKCSVSGEGEAAYRQPITGIMERATARAAVVLLWLIAAVLLGRGLYHSLSRGAWLSAAVALLYLICFKSFPMRQLSVARWCRVKRLGILGILVSTVVIGVWQLRSSESHYARRIGSVANPNDFSSRNRVAAWHGAAQMMLDRPFTGFGWGKAESVYAELYSTSTNSNETAAIQLNDYLMLGVSGGTPVMCCFLVYVALAFRRRVATNLNHIGSRLSAARVL